MKRKPAAAAKPHDCQDCICMGVGPKLSEMLKCRSEEAAGHLRNARVEFLKGLRALIDERIEHLSAKGKKGTSVPVE
jgi:hypothetical protein